MKESQKEGNFKSTARASKGMASTSYSSNFSTFHNETSSSNFQQSSRNRSNPPNFSYQSSTSQFKVPSTLKHFANAPSLFGPSNPHIEPKIEESYIGNLSNKPNYYGNSITFTRLTSSLNAPTIWQKCQEIESSIERLTTEQEFNDFREFFPILLGNIFGTDRGYKKQKKRKKLFNIHQEKEVFNSFMLHLIILETVGLIVLSQTEIQFP